MSAIIEPKFRRALLNKHALKSRGLSRTSLAAKCLCSVDALSSYHKGVSTPGGLILGRMAQALSTPKQRITSDWLLSIADLPSRPS